MQYGTWWLKFKELQDWLEKEWNYGMVAMTILE